jgi:hypothetical protein
MGGRQPAAVGSSQRENHVHIHGHRGSGRRSRERERLTPEQRAAVIEQALIWRQRWRDEMGARKTANGAAKPQKIKQPQQTNGPDRAKFAAGVARAEFGRFYWDERKSVRPRIGRSAGSDETNEGLS